MTGIPRLFGASYSVYVRIVRLALIEKGVAYDHVPVDVFAPSGVPAGHLERHPFGRIPAFKHDGFALYETGAIARYVDDAFLGPALQPVDAKARARCNQIVGIADNYVYPHLVWGVYVERVSKPRRGELSDEARIAAGLAMAETCLRALTDIMDEGPWLLGSRVTLADLYLAPMFAYFLEADEGRDLVERHGTLAAWWSRIAERPSMLTT